MTLLCVEIFLSKDLYAILSNQIYSLLLLDSKLTSSIFFHAFALVSLWISSVLNSRFPGPRKRALSHIVLEYNNENMRFIRLLLANQIPYIFRSNDKDIETPLKKFQIIQKARRENLK